MSELKLTEEQLFDKMLDWVFMWDCYDYSKAEFEPKEFLKKGYNMALKIKNREEAIAVLRDMVQRKKEMEKQVQEEFAKVRKEAELKKAKKELKKG